MFYSLCVCVCVCAHTWVKDISDCVNCNSVHLSLTPTTLISFSLTPQIHRSKNKWKFHLKDGIMNLNGRDYVFSKAIGDAEWWSRKKKHNKKQTKQQEQELCNSFYPVNRLFNILPYPVTGFISGNFFRVFENSWQTQRTVRYRTNLGCRQKKKNTRLALRDEKPTGEGKACD